MKNECRVIVWVGVEESFVIGVLGAVPLGGGAGCSRGIRGSCGKVASEKNMQVLVATFVKSLRKKAEESTSGAPGWLNRVSIQLWLRS